MTTNEVANRLVQLCREGKNIDAINELYGNNIVSIEPEGYPAPRVEGKEAVLGKTQQFFSMVEEYHGGEISDPVVAGNHFSVGMSMDITMKGQGRNKMEEVAVYEVQDGKIVNEQFFFNIPSQN